MDIKLIFPSNFGYHAGGIGAPDPNYFSNVDRINYSNDTATAVNKRFH